jgi:copper chaperone CopZ
MKQPIVILSFVLALVAGCNSAGKHEKGSMKENATLPVVDSSRLVTVVVPVGGMTCTGCENTIKGGIQTLPGIAEVSASYIDSVAIVTYDTARTSISSIDSVIRAKGYQVLSSSL